MNPIRLISLIVTVIALAACGGGGSGGGSGSGGDGSDSSGGGAEPRGVFTPTSASVRLSNTTTGVVQVAGNRSGRAAVVWSDLMNQRVYHAYYRDGDWDESGVLIERDGVGAFSCIEMDESGAVALVNRMANDVRLGSGIAPTGAPYPVTTLPGEEPCNVAADPTPGATAITASYADEQQTRLQLSVFRNGQWIEGASRDASDAVTLGIAGVAVDPMGRQHVVLPAGFGDGRVLRRYTHAADGGWTTFDVASTPHSVMQIRAGFGPAGQGAVVWTESRLDEGTEILRAADFAGSWRTTLRPNITRTIENLHLMQDPRGHSYASWSEEQGEPVAQDGYATGPLVGGQAQRFYSTRSQSTLSVGSHAVIDDQGVLVAAWHEAEAGLKARVRRNGSWSETEVIAPDGVYPRLVVLGGSEVLAIWTDIRGEVRAQRLSY